MRTKSFVGGGLLRLALVLPIVAFAMAQAIGQTQGPVITSARLEGTNIVVTVSVPDGIRRVTLECRDRLSGGTWAPRSVSRLDSSGGIVTFRLPRSRQIEMMRVRGDFTEPLPATFFTGTNEFFEAVSGESAVGPRGPMTPLNADVGTAPVQEPREVVESDIWKIRGQTLYFFNQLRGLQAIDLTNPDQPRVRGTLELPAVGEDMYLLGEKHVVLLARNGCSYNESEVVIGVDNGGSPAVTARLPVDGSIVESRLVGTALYVSSLTYRPTATGGGNIWESGTLVSGFDLSNPEAPVTRGSLWLSGYGMVVSATDRLLFVATQDPVDYWQSIVRTIDITSPDGSLRLYETVKTAGRVPDKFKLNWDGGILTTISEDWRPVAGRRLTTFVETFRLPDPRSMGPVGVVKLGQLEVGRGEQLFATRFNGKQLYIVTFFRIDPLWVIDLSNPATPKVAGSVDVPGWSTFIQPLGDRLVTIGVESNRVAVSLFGVANPAAPVLLDRVRLGRNYSFSEANFDEKAFSVLSGEGLILVPFSGDTTNGYASSVQLIDLKATSLTARGIIEHQFQPRRATVYSNRILSVSGWELLSVDATDRDRPTVKSSVPLAWPVDRVFLQGNYLVELGGAGGFSWWRTSDQPTLRVALAEAPNNSVTLVDLEDLAVLGATQRDSRLYVIQGPQGWFFSPFAVDAVATPASDTPQTKLVLTIFDLSGLPAVQKLGKVEASLSGFGFSELKATWPKPDLLVFSGGSGFVGWPCLLCPVPLAMDAGLRWPWFPVGGGGRLLAFDVADASAPQLAADVDLGANIWANFSNPFSANGMVYLSHQTSVFFDGPVKETPNDETPKVSPDEGIVGSPGPIVGPIPIGWWVTRSYLDVVDFADARNPVVRQPVNIPGQLNGISHGGSLLYTVGTHWSSNTANAWVEYLDASAYDGVSAHLVDSLALSGYWPRALLVSGTNVFIGWPSDAAGSGLAGVTNAPTLQTYYLSDAGKLTRSGLVVLKTPITALAAFGDLLAGQQSDNSVRLFDASAGGAPRTVGEGRPAGCQWFDLGHADGALGRGLWLPLGAYGVSKVAAEP